MQHPNLELPWYVASPNTPKTRNRIEGRSIIWTEKAALQDTECAHPDCGQPVADHDAPIPMCKRHITEVLYWSMREIRAEIDAAASILASIKPITPPPNAAGTSIVYYARIGSMIKIGTTTRARTRMETIKADLLAYEQGSYDIESQRHREYRLAHSHRELFYPAPELIEWIKILRGEAAAA